MHNQNPEQTKPDVEGFFSVYQTFLFMCESDSFDLKEKHVLFDSALALHGMSESQFDFTLNYLENNPREFLEAFESFDAEFRSELTRRMHE